MLGDTLKELRLNRGLTQIALANKLNLDKSSIAKYETNKATPSPEVLMNLAQIFDVSVDYLLGKRDIKNTPAPEGTDVSAEIKKVLDLAKSMTPEGQAELLAYAEYLAATKYKPKDPE